MKLKLFLAATIVGAGLVTVLPANGSYMSNCKTLISAWESCKESGGACKAEHQKIVKECKCHRLRQGSWKLVMAAVGKDGVCAPRPPKDPSPPPRDPPREKPPVTHGGERGPDARSPD